MSLSASTTAMAIGLLVSAEALAQGDPPSANATVTDSMPHRFSVLTTWHAFTNWLGDDIEMYEFHAGYRLTADDKVGIKAATWKLYQPLGIPLWNSKLTDKSQRYPGRLRESGAGAFYQRKLWKGLFAAAEVMLLRKTFLDHQDNELDSGIRLYTSYHLGYYVSFFNDRLFIEPQIHCNYWPVDSEGPPAFKELDDRWNNHFLFEPNLYIGINF
ncbi:MAG TPA: hypothetical protein VGF45_17790 [Polyangia bacterium]